MQRVRRSTQQLKELAEKYLSVKGNVVVSKWAKENGVGVGTLYKALRLVKDIPKTKTRVGASSSAIAALKMENDKLRAALADLYIKFLTK